MKPSHLPLARFQLPQQFYTQQSQPPQVPVPRLRRRPSLRAQPQSTYVFPSLLQIDQFLQVANANRFPLQATATNNCTPGTTPGIQYDKDFTTRCGTSCGSNQEICFNTNFGSSIQPSFSECSNFCSGINYCQYYTYQVSTGSCNVFAACDYYTETNADFDCGTNDNYLKHTGGP